MKIKQQKTIILISFSLLIIMYYQLLFFNKTAFASSPDYNTIISNSSYSNCENTLNETLIDLSNDTSNYVFKKEELHKNINEFKIEFIKKINSYLSENLYDEALNYINTYYYLFSNDEQLTTFKTNIETIINNNKLIKYDGNIEVLTFKPLISYPEQIFGSGNSNRTDLDEDRITISEFKLILKSLFENHYVLVSVNELISQNSLFLPKNKKPLLLLLEDAHYTTKNGSVDKLIISNDSLSTYTPKRPINDRIHDNNDFITILLDFIEKHPSFSNNNAKAVIAIDGHNGIFGYKTQHTNATSKYEIKKALKIINHLKSKGFSFVSRGYNLNINNSYADFANSLEVWHNDIRTITGNSDIFYLNPSTSSQPSDFDDKLKLLSHYNYNLIIGPDCIKNHISHDLNINYITSSQINGNALRSNKENLSRFFDCEKIYDHINRHIPYII